MEAVELCSSAAAVARGLHHIRRRLRQHFEVAGPLLAERRLPATVFHCAGFLDGGRMFNDTVIEAVRRAPASFDSRHWDSAFLTWALWLRAERRCRPFSSASNISLPAIGAGRRGVPGGLPMLPTT